jgi:hypothetical protein
MEVLSFLHLRYILISRLTRSLEYDNCKRVRAPVQPLQISRITVNDLVGQNS